MEREALKLVFDALKQCNTYAFAGGLGLRATAHSDALAILEKALAQPERKPLTDGQVSKIYAAWDEKAGASFADFARAIEAAHGIKENT